MKACPVQGCLCGARISAPRQYSASLWYEVVCVIQGVIRATTLQRDRQTSMLLAKRHAEAFIPLSQRQSHKSFSKYARTSQTYDNTVTHWAVYDFSHVCWERLWLNCSLWIIADATNVNGNISTFRNLTGSEGDHLCSPAHNAHIGHIMSHCQRNVNMWLEVTQTKQADA